MSPLRSAQTKAIIQLLLIIISYFPMSAISQRQRLFIQKVHLSVAKSGGDARRARRPVPFSPWSTMRDMTELDAFTLFGELIR